MRKEILIVAAHPDDEILGCGGSVARYIKDGSSEVRTLILGEGITSREQAKKSGISKKMQIKKLRTDARKANSIIGVKEVYFYDFPDNRFDTVALLDIVKVIEKVKSQIKPDIIFTHYRNDLNIDHRITYAAVLTSCRPIKGETVREIYSFEIPSSTEWNYPNNFNPNIFVDIAITITKKIEALKAYKTEIRSFPHPRCEEAMYAYAKRWASISGLEAAEAFEAVRIVR